MTPPTAPSEAPETKLLERLRSFQWQNYRLRIDDAKYLCREAADKIDDLQRRLRDVQEELKK